MAELVRGKYDASGSALEKELLDDTNSAVVREMASQLNQAEIPVVQRIAALADGTTGRVALGLWEYDAWIRNVFFVNDNGANALANVATDMAIIKYSAGAIDLTAAGTDIFKVEGFNTGGFAAKTALWSQNFLAGTNGDAVSGQGKGVIISAGELLAGEFVNNEGGPRNLIIGVTIVPTDFLSLQPGRFQREMPSPNQNSNTKPRGRY